MQIITGKYKNRILKTNKSDYQTSFVVRNAIFNIIASDIINSAVMELFSQDGYYGIESLSRGAKAAIINNNDKSHCKLIKKNVDEICVGDRIQIMNDDDCRVKIQSFNKIDIVFCKVREDDLSTTSQIISHIRQNKGSLKEILFVLETNSQEMSLVSEEFGEENVRRYGKIFTKIWKIQ